MAVAPSPVPPAERFLALVREGRVDAAEAVGAALGLDVLGLYAGEAARAATGGEGAAAAALWLAAGKDVEGAAAALWQAGGPVALQAAEACAAWHDKFESGGDDDVPALARAAGAPALLLLALRVRCAAARGAAEEGALADAADADADVRELLAAPRAARLAEADAARLAADLLRGGQAALALAVIEVRGMVSSSKIGRAKFHRGRCYV